MKRLIISLLAGTAGIASMLAGLGVDAWLHAGDPTLAQREGIFTLSNPGHALLGAGVLLVTGGLLSALHVAWGIARPGGILGRRSVRVLSMGASVAASLGALAFALGVSASGHEHAHADTAETHVHADGRLHEHEASESDASVDAAMLGADLALDEAGTAHAHAMSSARDTDHAHDAASSTADEIACGNDLVRRTQEATARFADHEAAVAEGYRSNPAKPNATHYGNRAYRLDGEVMDLSRPESLIYFTNPKTGEKALIGALFVMPRGEHGPQPCGAATQWHTHAACTSVATREAIPVDHGEACAEGYRYGESAEMMHVWFIPGRKNGVAPVI